MLYFLLSLADESDHDKILYIYNRYHDDMIRFARNRLRMAGNPNYKADAEDVVQNAFVKMSLYIKSIDFGAEEYRLRSYVFSTVSREIINEINDKHEFEDLDEHLELESDEDFVDELMLHDHYGEVVSALEKLDEKYRLVLLYRYGEEYDPKQIAELFGIPEKTVYTRLARAKVLLKEQLQKRKKRR